MAAGDDALDDSTSPEILRDLRQAGAFLSQPWRERPAASQNPEVARAAARAIADALYGRNRDRPPPGAERRGKPPVLPPFAGRPDPDRRPVAQPIVPIGGGPRKVERPSVELRPGPAREAPRAPRPTAAIPPPPSAAPAAPPAEPPPSAEKQAFVAWFLRENPGAKTGDAEVAWGAALRSSTIEL
jgi:hypothetical protein